MSGKILHMWQYSFCEQVPMNVPLQGDRARELMEHLQAISRRHLFGDKPPRGDQPALTREEIRTLITAGAKARWRMGDLARELGTSQSAFTVVVNRLVRKRLLCRRRLRSDRRVVEVRLTPRGQTQYREGRRRRLRMARAMLGALNPNEQRRLLNLIRKIRARIAGSIATSPLRGDVMRWACLHRINRQAKPRPR